MNSDEIYDAIRVIAQESSINAKRELLERYLQDASFKWVITIAMEPLANFGVLPEYVKPPQGACAVFGERTLNLLGDLHSRKLTGNEALAHVDYELKHLSPKSSMLLVDILNKDLKANIGVKLVNKAYGAKLLTEHPYMRCSLPKDVKLETWPWERGVFSQVKMDGMYATAVCNNSVDFFTRKGHVFPDNERFKILKENIKSAIPEGVQLSGELLVMRGGKFLDRKTGNGILNSILKTNADIPANLALCYIAWDMISNEEAKQGKSPREYEQRINELMTCIHMFCKSSHLRAIETNCVYSLEEAQKDFAEKRKAGEEGTIIKRPDGLWKNGTSRDQVKLKEEAEADLCVVSMLEGTGKNEDLFGSLLCETSDGRLRVAVSGFTDEARAKIFNSWGEDNWAGAIIAVKYNEVIKQRDSELYSLFLPRFVERRYDKEEADTLERLLNQ